MSFFSHLKDDIVKTFHPVEQAVEHFDPKQTVDAVETAVEHGVETALQAAKAEAVKVLPGHVHVGDAVDILKIARPSWLKVDVFAGFGLTLGIELDLQFGMGMTVRDPVQKVENIASLIDSPPETVHQLCDRLWGIVPSEVVIHEQLQAVVGQYGEIGWDGEDVMQHVVEYIGQKGWLEKRIKP